MTSNHASRDTYDELVSREGWVLVDVWGPQCASPCKAFMPHIEQLADRHPDLTVVKLEAPKARRVGMDLRVMGLPTLLLYREGEEVSHTSDPDLNGEQVDQWPTNT